MDIINVLLFTTVCVLVRVDATLHIEEDKSAISWTIANNRCTLATPRIEYDIDGTIRVNIDQEDLELKKNRNYWIGYLRAFTVYHYLGCVNLNTSGRLFGHVIKVVESSQLERCLSYCSKYDIAGISCKTSAECTCYCIKGQYTPQNAENKQPHCTTPCTSLGIACGEVHLSGHYVSLYKAVPNPLPTEQQNSSTCFAYDKPGAAFTKEGCNARLRHLCETELPAVEGVLHRKDVLFQPVSDEEGLDGSSSVVQVGPHVVQSGPHRRITDQRHAIAHNNTYLTWIAASNNCFNSSTNTANIRDKNILGNAIGNSKVQFWTGWTGIANGIRVYKDPTTLPNSYQVGYLRKSGGQINFGFTDISSSFNSWICMAESNTTSSSTTKSISSETSTPPLITGSSLNTTTVTVSGITSTFTNSTQDAGFTKKQTHSEEDVKSSVGVYVGVVVACLVCICIAVCLVLWRKGLLPRILVKKDKARPKSNSTYEGDTVNVNDVNIGFGRSNVSEVHNYEKVDSVELNTNANTNDYDFAKEVPKDTETDNTYNHINSSVNKQKNSNKNNTYDTASSALKYQNNIKDNTYDTTSGSGFAVNKTETENVYNKLNDPLDNTYSHLNTSHPTHNDKDDSTYDTSNSPALNTNPTDNDEYSHINTPHGKIEQQEDKYAKANFN